MMSCDLHVTSHVPIVVSVYHIWRVSVAPHDCPALYDEGLGSCDHHVTVT